jgi:hypothetical protein
MTDHLGRRLATAIDSSAPAVTTEEVMRRPYVPTEGTAVSHRPRRRLLAVAAVVAVLGLGAAAWSRVQDAPSSGVTTGVTDAASAPSGRGTVTVDPTTCGDADATGGCPASPEQAEQALHIPLPDPSGIPSGWEVVDARSRIRYWPATGDTPAVADFNQVWAPVGEDLDAAGTVPSYVQLRRRAALPAESEPFAGQPVVLPSGVTAYLAGTSIRWSARGVTTQLSGYGVSPSDLERIAASLE